MGLFDWFKIRKEKREREKKRRECSGHEMVEVDGGLIYNLECKKCGTRIYKNSGDKIDPMLRRSYVFNEQNNWGKTKDENPLPQNGYGTFTFSVTGITYEGEWKDGLKHGNGKEIDSSGNIVNEGVWEKGILITPSINLEEDTIFNSQKSNTSTQEYNDTELEEILKMDPNSSCILHHNLIEEFSSCYYQFKNDSPDRDRKIISKWDEKYDLYGFGNLGPHFDYESVFDPTQEVLDSSLETVFKREMTSSTFIGLFQKKINEYIDVEDGETLDEFFEWLELGTSHSFLENLCDKIGCTDYKTILEKDDDTYLWFTYYQLDEERQEFWIENDNK